MVDVSRAGGEGGERVLEAQPLVGTERLRPAVVRWDATKTARQRERLARVAREAAMQSRRLWLPTVAPLASFEELVGQLGKGAALAHPGGAPPSLERPSVLVGPEGGFSSGELDRGLPTVGLGPTVLRAETAAVAAGLVLCWLRAGIVRSVAN